MKSDEGPKPRAAGHGGRRAGSGRKKAAAVQAKLSLNESINARIGARSGEVLDALFVLALGARMRDDDDDGGDSYVTPPDRQACEYLLNRVLGKPTEHKEVSGPDGAAIPVSIVAAIDRVYGAEASG
jgi:hypothetical protein